MKIMTRRVLAAAMAIVLVRCGDSKSPTASAPPPISPGNVAGSWAGTYSVHLHWCNVSDIRAKVTLRQQDSAVSGTIDIEQTNCGIQGTFDFKGAMNGNTLSGTILRAGTVVSTGVWGSLSDASLSIDLGKDSDDRRCGSLALRR